MSQGDAARASERWSLQPTNSWAGIYNTYYWIDPKKRIAAVFMTQVLPFADQRVLRVYRQFERGIYGAIKAGYVKAG